MVCNATGVDLHWLLGNATQSSSQTLIEFLWETDVEHRLSSQHCPNLNDVGIDYEHDKVMGLRRWEIDGVDSKAKKMKPIMDRGYCLTGCPCGGIGRHRALAKSLKRAT